MERLLNVKAMNLVWAAENLTGKHLRRAEIELERLINETIQESQSPNGSKEPAKMASGTYTLGLESKAG